MQQRNQSSPLAPAVMVHFYRGVMDLATTWRTRVDSTTNWAVISAGSIASFLLSDRTHPHLMALLGMFLAFAFLSIEARRFRFYDLWSGWLRLMETDYYGPILRDNVVEQQLQWHPLLVADLRNPHFKISWSEAMGRRLRHNYIAIFLFLLLVWLVKLLPPDNPQPGSCTTFTACASIGPIPGWLVLSGVAVFYAYLTGLVLFTPKLVGTGTELIGRHLLFRRLVAPSAQLVGFKRHRDLPFIVDGVSGAPEED